MTADELELQRLQTVFAQHAESTHLQDQQRAADALMDQALVLDRLERHDEELLVYDRLVSGFGDSAEPRVRVQVAWALARKSRTLVSLGRYDEAITCCDELLARDSGDESAIRDLVSGAFQDKVDALIAVDRLPEVVATCDAMLSTIRASGDDGREVDAATALGAKAEALAAIGRLNEALAVCDEHIARFGDSDDTDRLVKVALALQRRASVLWDLGRSHDAIATYSDITQRFADSTDPWLAEVAFDAIEHRSWGLSQLGRYDEAIAVCDDVIRQAPAEERPEDTVELALRRKAAALGELKRYPEVAAVAAELRSRCARTGNHVEYVHAARSETWALRWDGRDDEALDVYGELIDRARAWDDIDTIRPLAKAMHDYGETLVSAGRPGDAITAADDLVRTYGSLDDPTVQEAVVEALNMKAGLLLLSGDGVEEAIVILDGLVSQLVDAQGPMRNSRAQALSNLGQGYGLAGRFDEALAALRDFVAEFGDDPEPDRRDQVALALGNIHAILTEVVDAPDEAEAVEARLMRDFPDAALRSLDAAAAQGAESLEPHRRAQRIGALYKKAKVLHDLDRAADALALIGAIEAEYEGDQDPVVGHAFEAALELRDAILDGTED